MTPDTAAYRFLCCLVLGAALGLFYGFLRPLRPKYTTLSDLLFLPVMGWVWLVSAFAVCRGDIRMGCNLGLLAGALLWEWTVGMWLRPVFFEIWKRFGAISRFFLRPAKKILNFVKILS